MTLYTSGFIDKVKFKNKQICIALITSWIEIDDMQFGFMKGKGTTDAIFMARQMQENFRVKGKKLYFGFVDLEKAFDRVPREVASNGSLPGGRLPLLSTRPTVTLATLKTAATNFAAW